MKSAPHLAQLENTQGMLMGISNDSLLKPLRMMAGLAAPGEDIGGWYSYREDYNYRTDTVGFAPGCNYGQWVSALARNYGMTGDAASREKVLAVEQAVCGDDWGAVLRGESVSGVLLRQAGVRVDGFASAGAGSGRVPAAGCDDGCGGAGAAGTCGAA